VLVKLASFIFKLAFIYGQQIGLCGVLTLADLNSASSSLT